MMTYFVIYVLGTAAMVVGPTGTDTRACDTYRVEQQKIIEEKFKGWGGVMPSKIKDDPREIKLKDVVLACITSSERPQLGSTLQ